ncbi:MAG: hypothetical protein E6Q97_37885 [Desulfurellales bacterium]|nr:MAG: hypothetical protein E6Q97_37885 [Desulfurellales bacterium]
MEGRKILIKAKDNSTLATLLRGLARDIEQIGSHYANSVNSEGRVVMRPLREGEPDYYQSSVDLP